MAEAATSETQGPSSSDLPPLPENRNVVGFGMVSVDYVAIVDAFPKPDEKVRGRSLQISDGGTSTSTYVIVDKQMKTRTCIYTLGVPAMVPDDLPKMKLLSVLSEAKLAYFDGRSTKPALVVAQEAARMSIPILVEAERKKDGLVSLLDLATYIICSEKFPQAWTSVSSIPKALVAILLKYPTVRFVIVTLGEKGCLMIDRRTCGEDPHLDCIDVESLTESLKLRIDENVSTPTFVSSESSVGLRANGIGTIYGKLLLGTAEKIPPSEILDTTGAGDAFIGAVLYALCAGMPPEKMLPFACQVAAICCRALGARTGLPYRADPRLAPFLH